MKLTKLFTIAIVALFIGQSYAAGIECSSERLGQVFKIAQTQITLADNDGRSIASLGARTKIRGESVEKIVNYNNKKMTIHIGNKKSFSPLNDYIVLKNSHGHEITYPLDCQ